MDQEVDDELENAQSEVLVRSPIFYILFTLLGLLLVSIGVGIYLTYPFSTKVKGTWENPELNMVLTSKSTSWTAELTNYQEVDGYTLLYKGKWQANGINIYDSTNVKVQIILDKSKISENEIKKLEKKSPLYTTIKNSAKVLQLEYTEKGLKQVYHKTSVDNFFHFSLEPVLSRKKEQVLYLNHSYFSDERLPFKLINE
ncbi:hypothetical protein ATZ33_08300 [Enterococcus silesiacus]|uniref:DUF5067 domain-containing protein n=1 Tax=Enterococcus silesiacus TaxID=332949 RepID=A0ABM5WDE7_9ENTE|nr:hypothetical protein ATZ33_08300 [Enterococcus silesiacus]